MAKIKITLTKSTIGVQPRQRRIVEALGLNKINKTVELDDTPATRGAIRKVSHLVLVTEENK